MVDGLLCRVRTLSVGAEPTMIKRWTIRAACAVVALELFVWLAAVIGAFTLTGPQAGPSSAG